MLNSDQIAGVLEQACYELFCDWLPGGLDMSGPDDEDMLVVTNGERHFDVDIFVSLSEMFECPECEGWVLSLGETGVCRKCRKA